MVSGELRSVHLFGRLLLAGLAASTVFGLACALGLLATRVDETPVVVLATTGGLVLATVVGAVVSAAAIWTLLRAERRRSSQATVVFGCNVVLGLVLFVIIAIYVGSWLLSVQNLVLLLWPVFMAAVGSVCQLLALPSTARGYMFDSEGRNPS